MRPEMSSASVKFISLRRNELITALTATAERIGREHPKVEAVRLFGSVARGDQVGASDADVMIVLRGKGSTDILESIRTYLSYFILPVGVDVLVFGEADIEQRLKEYDLFMQQIWQESIVLYQAEETVC